MIFTVGLMQLEHLKGIGGFIAPNYSFLHKLTIQHT